MRKRRGGPVFLPQAAHGAGLKEDPLEAAKWHLLARDAGVSDFWLDLYMARLSQEQRSKAERAAKAWVHKQVGG